MIARTAQVSEPKLGGATDGVISAVYTKVLSGDTRSPLFIQLQVILWGVM